MAERWAVATGNWSNTATWNGGTLPGVGDVVHANGFNVTIDQSINVGTITTAAGTTPVAGGTFYLRISVNIFCNVVAGTTACLTSDASSGTPNQAVYGNVTGGSGGTNAYGWAISGTTYGNLFVHGNVLGGSAGTNPHGVVINTGGSITVNGNVTGGSGVNAVGVVMQSTANVTVNGVVTGGSNASSSGVSHSGSGLLTVANGTSNAVVGGTVSSTAYGVFLASTARFAITGNVVASSAARGLLSSSTGTGNTIVGNVIGDASRGLEFSGSAAGASLTVTGNVWCTNTAAYGIAMLNANCSLTITGNVVQNVGSAVLLNATNQTVVVNGSVTGPTSASGRGILCNTGSTSGTITVNGTVTGGSNSSAVGVETQTGWTVTAQNVVGGPFTSASGIRNNGTGTVNVTQNVTGGPNTNSDGVTNAGTGIVNVTGDAIGGAGTNAYGVNNVSTGTVTITGTARGSATTGGVGVFNTSTGSVTVGSAEFGAAGWPPYAGIVFFANLDTARVTVEDSTLATRTLLSGGYVRWPVATGNWSSLANWDYGLTMPQTVDEVHADGKNVTVDQDVTVIVMRTSQRVGGLNGGSFICTSNRTINANIVAGGAVGLSITSPCTVVVNGSITGGTVTTAYGVRNSAVVNLTINGTVTGGTGTGSAGVHIADTGASVFIINGNVIGGEGTSCRGLQTAASGTQSITINGSVFGSVGSGLGEGVYINSSGCSFNITGTLTARGNHAFQQLAGSTGVTCVVNGDVYASATHSARYGIAIGGTGTFTVNGNAYGGPQSFGYGIYVSGNATYNHNGNTVGGSGSSSYGIYVAAGSAVFTMTGNATGGSGGAGLLSQSPFTMTGNAQGGTAINQVGVIANTASGTITFTGNAIGGSATNTHGFHVQSFTGTLNFYGNATGGSGSNATGLLNGNSVAIVNLYGDAIGGPNSASFGAAVTSTGTLNVYGVARASTTTPAVNNNTATGVLTIRQAVTGPTGMSPWTGNGPIFFNNLDLAYVTVTNAAHVQRMLGRRSLAPVGNMDGGLDG